MRPNSINGKTINIFLVIDLINNDSNFGKDTGDTMYKWASDLFPINRSITGQGVRDTLNYIKAIEPSLVIKSVKSGMKVFDWQVPKEWNVRNAYIIGPDGNKFADFKVNNLHLMGYSIPVEETLELEELNKHLHSLPNQPNAIPYVTSYYKEDWGFCITQFERDKLERGQYKVFIDATLEDGILNYGELLIKGRSEKELLISTYVCHPSMANNELSGPVVASMIIKWLKSLPSRRYTYRFVFVPETIGSIVYINENYYQLRTNCLGGFVVTCVGDNNNYSLLESKNGDTFLDCVGRHVMRWHTNNKYSSYSFLKRGSDERQYSSVGVDLPMISLMRSKYGEYVEYHTSLDNLDFISADGLYGAFRIHKKAIEVLETNVKYSVTSICEPQLGKRGLYPLQSTKDTQEKVELMMNLIAYCDGSRDLLSVADIIEADYFLCLQKVNDLLDSGLMIKIDE